MYHIECLPSDIDKYKCTICGYSTNRKAYLKKHMDYVHSRTNMKSVYMLQIQRTISRTYRLHTFEKFQTKIWFCCRKTENTESL